jgi:2-polyprenyl-3-methyl-5-hydroxy-6-metoxy-1,4-benzoquinol methylase
MSYQYFEDVNWGLLRLWGGRRGLDVLDVGCGFATTSERIRACGNRVTGIESAAEAVEFARARIDEVIAGDLLHVDLGGRRFDAILFADILEHLPWPEQALARYLPLLKPDGRVFISLPNIGLWSVRLSLAFGRFQYEETGVLDRTHLRFFTRRTAKELIAGAGLRIVARTYNPGLLRPVVPLAKKLFASADEKKLEPKPYGLYLKTIYPAERAVARLWPGALAFQMIFEAARA